MNKILSKFLFGFVYTIGYFFLAILSTGGGHGNFYLMTPLMPWIFIFVVIFLFGRLESLRARIFFVCVMAFHYGLLALILLDYPFAEDKGWIKYHSLPYIPIAWYLAGQIIIWLQFFSEIKGKMRE